MLTPATARVRHGADPHPRWGPNLRRRSTEPASLDDPFWKIWRLKTMRIRTDRPERGQTPGGRGVRSGVSTAYVGQNPGGRGVRRVEHGGSCGDTAPGSRFAFRLLWKDRVFAATTILTLALCIGANTAIFAVVRSVLLRPLPYPAGRAAGVRPTTGSPAPASIGPGPRCRTTSIGRMTDGSNPGALPVPRIRRRPGRERRRRPGDGRDAVVLPRAAGATPSADGSSPRRRARRPRESPS